MWTAASRRCSTSVCIATSAQADRRLPTPFHSSAGIEMEAESGRAANDPIADTYGCQSQIICCDLRRVELEGSASIPAAHSAKAGIAIVSTYALASEHSEAATDRHVTQNTSSVFATAPTSMKFAEIRVRVDQNEPWRSDKVTSVTTPKLAIAASRIDALSGNADPFGNLSRIALNLRQNVTRDAWVRNIYFPPQCGRRLGSGGKLKAVRRLMALCRSKFSTSVGCPDRTRLLFLFGLITLPNSANVCATPTCSAIATGTSGQFFRAARETTEGAANDPVSSTMHKPRGSKGCYSCGALGERCRKQLRHLRCSLVEARPSYHGP